MRDAPSRAAFLAAVVCPVDQCLLDWLHARCQVAYLPDAQQTDFARDEVTRCDLLILRSNVAVGASELGSMARLRVVLRLGSGIDNLDLSALAAQRVTVLRIGGRPAAPAVAELALQAAITLFRRVPIATVGLAAGRWEKNDLRGREIAGSMVGIWGAGPVGQATADLFTRMQANVIFAAHPRVPSRIPTLPLPALCRSADLHVVALPLHPATCGLVGNALIAVLAQRSPHLVNVGRWDVLDMPAVLGALGRGDLAGVAVDPVDRGHVAAIKEMLAPYDEAGQVLNLQLTPHLGAMTHATYQRAASAAITVLEANWSRLTEPGRDDD